jgi:rod shape-determining protein MreC
LGTTDGAGGLWPAGARAASFNQARGKYDDEMLKRPHYVALGLLVLLTLTILNLPGRASDRLKLGIGSFFAPLFGLATSTRQLAGQAGDAVVPRSELLRQNAALRQQVQELNLKAARMDELERENARFREFFGWQKQLPGKPRLARVVAREPANWWRTIQIGLGSRDGLRTNLPVLTAEGYLAGRVSLVSLTHSQVVLVGDATCKVSALVENNARDNGVVGASGPLDTSLVEMAYLPANADVKPGQIVVTSGLGGIFPKNVPIGKVVDSRSVEFGLGTAARVRLGANLNDLEEVWVMTEP